MWEISEGDGTFLYAIIRVTKDLGSIVQLGIIH